MSFRAKVTFVACAGWILALVTCGGSETIVDKTCTPGQSAGCVGPQGCSGFQVCSSDGTKFEACQCGGGGGSASSSSASSAASVGSGGSASSSVASTSTSAMSSAVATGTGGGAAWSPKMLTGLALWLDDDVGLMQSGGVVKQWLDQSGHNNDASTINGSPSVDAVVLNGHDAVKTDNGFLAVSDSPTMHFGKGDFAITMVIKTMNNGNPSSSQFWTTQNGPDPANYFAGDPSGNFQIVAGLQKAVIPNPKPNKFNIVTARGQKVRLDSGGTFAMGGTNDLELNPSGVDTWIGISAGGDVLEIAEVVAVNGALSDADLALLEGYLKTKFKL